MRYIVVNNNDVNKLSPIYLLQCGDIESNPGPLFRNLLGNLSDILSSVKTAYKTVKQIIFNKEEYKRNGEISKIQNKIDKLLSKNKKGILTYTKNGNLNAITIKNKQVQNILNNKIESVKEHKKEIFGSDPIDEFDYLDESVSNIDIRELPQSKSTNDGHYFEFYNNTPFNLERYEIFSKEKHPKELDHCLFVALKHSNVLNEFEMERLKKYLIGYVKKSDLKHIAEDFNIYIHLSEFINGEIRKKYYGLKTNTVVMLGLFENHYFINDIVPYHKSSVLYINEDKWINNDRRFEIYFMKGNKINYSSNYKQCALSFIKNVFDNNGFEKFKLEELLHDNDFYKFSKEKDTILIKEDIINLDIKKKNEKRISDNICFADFEATTESSTHQAFMICYTYEGDYDIKSIRGFDCAYKFLCDLKKNSIVYFHNLKYDWQHIFKNVHVISMCEKSNQIYAIECLFGGKKITFMDSLKMIQMPLKSFPKAFNLKSEKQIMPYNLYTVNNLLKSNCKIDEALKHIKQKNKEQFIKNLKDLDICYIDTNGDAVFDHWQYAEYYCKMDVRVLSEGMTSFRSMTKKALDMDIYKYKTISSLAHNYFIKEGCYDGVIPLYGSIRDFVNKSIVGGRVYLGGNKKHLVNERVQDFDAVSLYGSAMCVMEGFPLGLAAIYDQNSNLKLEDQDYYVIEIKIISQDIVNYDIPMMSYRENDENIWTNYLVGKTVIIDKITFLDYIKYYNIKYEIIKGVYWNGGLNTKMNEKVTEMIQLRYEYKKQKNPIQLILKLIVNAAYGKTIERPSENKIVFIKKKDSDNFLSKNYNLIENMESFNKYVDKFYLYNNVYNHSGLTHCGGIVLSTSKQIMNEVNDVAFKNNVEVLYTDTDSMHIRESGVKIIEKKFKDIYDRDLIGEDICQFHCDFESKLIKSNICSVKTIILGKKCYLDILSGENILGETVTDLHYRMKGISHGSIRYYCKHNNIDEETLYEKLYNGEKIKFNLCEGSIKFEFIKGKGVKTKMEFIREISF